MTTTTNTQDAGEIFTCVAAVQSGTAVYSTSDEINRATKPSTRVIPTTATSLVVTAALHGSKTILVNSVAPIAVTLPAATGSGEIYSFQIGVACTGTASTIKVANATDVMAGYSFALTTASAGVVGYATSATSDTVSLNGGTLGGVAGDKIVIMDIATGIFSVDMKCAATGTTATPFSATVS